MISRAQANKLIVRKAKDKQGALKTTILHIKNANKIVILFTVFLTGSMYVIKSIICNLV
jgi:hypothetical protein